MTLTPAGRPDAACQHEVGLPVAAGMAGRRRGGAGFEKPQRERLQAGRGAAHTVARRPGRRTGSLRVEGPAVDPGQGCDAGPAPVRGLLLAARDLVPAAPPGLHSPGSRAPGRGAGRGEDRRVAHPDLGEGTRLAAATGAWICFEDESGQALQPPKARTWGRRGHTPVVRVSGRGSGRISVAGLACFKAGSRAGSSTGCKATGSARGPAGPCPRQTTPAWSPPRTVT